jgi:hypothetical protein
MVYCYNHMLRRKTSWISPGAATAYVAITWLNASKEHAGKKRIIELLQTANELATLTTSGELPTIHPLTWKPKGTRTQLKNLRRSGRLVRRLRRQLSRYKVYPEVSLGRNGVWRQHWKALTRTSELPITVSAQGDTESYSFCEEDVVLRILELAKQGNLHRIRKCRYCGNWFFARVRHGNYCQRKCQQANFRTSEAFLAKRRKYMRKYRRDETLRNIRASVPESSRSS